MAEETFELRLEPEGFQIIPVGGAELGAGPGQIVTILPEEISSPLLLTGAGAGYSGAGARVEEHPVSADLVTTEVDFLPTPGPTRPKLPEIVDTVIQVIHCTAFTLTFILT